MRTSYKIANPNSSWEIQLFSILQVPGIDYHLRDFNRTPLLLNVASRYKSFEYDLKIFVAFLVKIFKKTS